MINNKKVLAVIPARGGSKGVPRKNIRVIANKPLIGWTIQEAKKSKYIDQLVLSSEDNEIIKIAKEWGCEVVYRPGQLAMDDTPGIEPIIHVLNCLPGFDYVVVLQPTSPLREVVDIDKCIEALSQSDSSSCVSVCRPSKSPFWSYTMDMADHLLPLMDGKLITNRQQLPKVFVLNGAVYVAETKYLMEKRTFMYEMTIGYEMPLERSLDIDTEMDLEICQYFLNKKQNTLH